MSMLKVRQIREEREITLRELSLLTGIPAPNLSEIERGNNTTILTLQRIATAFGLHIKEMFADD